MPPTLVTTGHDRRRERTGKAILDAAERAFTAEGFGGARMDDIAADAGVSVGSLYSHFGGKDGLWAALAERAIERFDAYLQMAYRPEWTALEQVCACGDAYLRFHVEHPGSFHFLAFQTEANARLQEVLGGFEAKIAEAMASGEARTGDPRLMALFLWSAWNATVALTARDDVVALSEQDAAAALQQARRMVLEGLAAPGHRGADGLALPRLRTVDSPPPDGD